MAEGAVLQDITGLVLAGGRGSRMGGVDKGLQLLWGRPLAGHVVERLIGQVASVVISANRNLDQYRALGCPVVVDTAGPHEDFPGPLAGILAGLLHCPTPWLLTAPCDAPLLPADYAARMHRAALGGNCVAVMALSRHREQPTCCLLSRTTAADLESYLAGGGRRVKAWIQSLSHRIVSFDEAGDDPQAFANVNTPQDLARLASDTLR